MREFGPLLMIGGSRDGQYMASPMEVVKVADPIFSGEFALPLPDDIEMKLSVKYTVYKKMTFKADGETRWVWVREGISAIEMFDRLIRFYYPSTKTKRGD